MGTIPDFLNTDFGYYSETGVTDVSSILTTVNTLLTDMTLPWTSPSTGRYVSHKATPTSRFIDFALTRVDATTLGFQAYNMGGAASGNRRMYITAGGGGSTIKYLYGQHHIVIVCIETGELACMFLLDNSPFSPTMGTQGAYVMYASRDTSNMAGYGNWYSWCYRYPAESGATFSLATCGISPTVATSTSTDMTDVAGNNIFMPLNVASSGSIANQWQGRLHQALLCSDALADYAEVAVPLGDGTTGVFYVLPRTAGYGCKMCVRKA
jgi:hypothetical protein